MILSKSRRVRFLFRTAASDRQFCWFEQREDDLYFGSSEGATIEGAVGEVDKQGLTISVPDEIKKIDGELVKASFHASGQFHIKRGGKPDENPMQWPLKEEIKAPYRIAALISKPPRFYTPYASGRTLTRGGASAGVIQVDEEGEAIRFNFEFFLSPEGGFTLSRPLLAGTTEGYGATEPLLFSLSTHLILVTRYFGFAPGSALNTWHPELEAWIYGGDQPNAASAPE
jgi:hypothetical protein